MHKIALSLFSASLFVTGCLFPSFDDMQGTASATDPKAESNATQAPDAKTTTISTPGAGASGSGGAANAPSSNAADASTPIEAGPRPVASIKCGTATCSGATQFCCGTNGWGGFCKDLGQESQCTGDSGDALHCDDNADCGTGEVCCLGAARTATCGTSCSGGKVLCRGNAGCPTGQSCTGVIDHLWGATTNFCQ